MFWYIKALEVVPRELDFTSSGQGHRGFTSIESKGVCLVSACELVELDSGRTQVLVCEACGVPRCEPGGWVSVRRLGPNVAWVPAWREMAGGAWEEAEYSPPRYLETRGGPVFDAVRWSEVRRVCGEMPQVEELEPLVGEDVLQLLRVAGPDGLMSQPGEHLQLQRDVVLAVTEGLVDEELEAVDLLLSQFKGARACEIVSGANVARIEFWLDLPGTPSCAVFGRAADRIGLIINDGELLVPETSQGFERPRG